SPRAISSAIIANVRTSVPFSISTPPYSSGTPKVRMPIFSASSRMRGGSRSSGTIDHSRCQFCFMNGRTTSSTKSRQLCCIIRCSSDRPLSADVRSSIAASFLTLLRGFSARQKITHAVERLQDVFRRIGVRHPHIAFTQNSEIRPSDDGNSRILQQRRSERLCLPSGAFHVRKSIKCTFGCGTGDAWQLVESFDHDLSPLVAFGHHFVHFVLRT